MDLKKNNKDFKEVIYFMERKQNEEIHFKTATLILADRVLESLLFQHCFNIIEGFFCLGK